MDFLKALFTLKIKEKKINGILKIHKRPRLDYSVGEQFIKMELTLPLRDFLLFLLKAIQFNLNTGCDILDSELTDHK